MLTAQEEAEREAEERGRQNMKDEILLAVSNWFSKQGTPLLRTELLAVIEDI